VAVEPWDQKPKGGKPRQRRRRVQRRILGGKRKAAEAVEAALAAYEAWGRSAAKEADKGRTRRGAEFNTDATSEGAHEKRGLFDGSVYSGRTAVEVGFADGFGDTIQAARQRYGENVELRRYFTIRRPGFTLVRHSQLSASTSGGSGGGGLAHSLEVCLRQLILPLAYLTAGLASSSDPTPSLGVGSTTGSSGGSWLASPSSLAKAVALATAAVVAANPLRVGICDGDEDGGFGGDTGALGQAAKHGMLLERGEGHSFRNLAEKLQASESNGGPSSVPGSPPSIVLPTLTYTPAMTEGAMPSLSAL